MKTEPATIAIERDSLEADVRDLNTAIIGLLEVVFAESDSHSKGVLQTLHPVLSKQPNKRQTTNCFISLLLG